MNDGFYMWVAVTVYLLAGVGLVLVGPIGASIVKEVNARTGWPYSALVSRRKLFLFRSILTTGGVLLWPFALIAARSKPEAVLEPELPSGLYFHLIGGVGEVICRQCTWREEITSFTHSGDISDTGFQCQKCGLFASIKDTHAESIPSGCKCGGTLDRRKVLFCPKCGSQELRYQMEYIT